MLEFHTQGGFYYKTRVPIHGRDMAYDASACELYICGAGNSVHRLSLQEGRFMIPLRTGGRPECSSGGAGDGVSGEYVVQACAFNMEHRLFTCATNEGIVECWDPRMHTRAALFDCAAPILAYSRTHNFPLPSTWGAFTSGRASMRPPNPVPSSGTLDATNPNRNRQSIPIAGNSSAISSVNLLFASGQDAEFGGIEGRTADSDQLPWGITALAYRDALNFAVGMQSGVMGLFDLRPFNSKSRFQRPI